MDVTMKASILEVKKVIEQKEGKLHILVNKCVMLCHMQKTGMMLAYSTGQAGLMSLWFNDLTSPQQKDAEALGQALFSELEEEWVDVFAINVY